MGSKWKQTTLGDLALGFDGAVDGPFGSNLPAAAYTDSGGNDSNLLIVFYVQIMPDDFVMQLHRF